VVAVLALLSLAATRAVQALETARERESRLTGEIEREEEAVLALTEQVGRLRRDPLALETAAREELGWVRPGELLVVFESDPPPRPSVVSPSSVPAPASD
jgi:cell division protein FtsB